MHRIYTAITSRLGQLRHRFVKEIDLEAGRMVIEPIPGLLED